MIWTRGGLTGLICRDNNGVHARPLGSSGVEHRPDGATTQEVYNRALQITTYLIIKQGAGSEARASSHPEDEDKCLEKGPDTTAEPHPQRSESAYTPDLRANMGNRMSKVHNLLPFANSLEHHIDII